jgi:hypothetical protein
LDSIKANEAKEDVADVIAVQQESREEKMFKQLISRVKMIMVL